MSKKVAFKMPIQPKPADPAEDWVKHRSAETRNEARP